MEKLENFMPDLKHQPYITETLRFRRATHDDLSTLRHIAKSWTQKELTEGEPFTEEGYIASIEGTDLPPIPTATADRQVTLIIESITLDCPIGFVELYHGYPDEDTLWIGMFVIDADARRHGFGKTAIEALSLLASDYHLKFMGIGVSLKNWTGLKFWHSVGFKTLFSVHVDTPYDASKHGLVGILKTL
ncbi:GNAT family N-acetyltransferase [Fusibacter bizertensis]